MFDVRFLPNPYYEISLREKNGQDPGVRNYVFCDGTADRYLDYLFPLLDFLIPQYTKEGKAVLTIGIGILAVVLGVYLCKWCQMLFAKLARWISQKRRR